MMSYEEILERLKNTLTEDRFAHTMGVVDASESLALRYGCDVNKARIAALCHDCAKNLDLAELKKLCKKYKIRLDNVSKCEGRLLHAYVGAHLAEEEFGVTDPEIFDAIYYHTTGKRDMSLLCKIIFLADMIEPGRRNLEFLDEIRRMAYIDLDRAIIMEFDSTIAYVIKMERLLHPDTIKARNYLIETRKDLDYGK